jgi:RND family efflux transporter MFP subunit
LKEYITMKRVVLTAVVSIVLGLAIGWLVFRPSTQSGGSKDRKVLYYRDPMNPQITSETPRKASDGMDFVPVYAEGSSQSGGRKIAYYKDPMHPWYTSEKPGKAPDCGMDLVPVYEGESDVKGIKIDPVTVQNIGVKVEEVVRKKLDKVIRTNGKVDYDERKVYSVNTKVMGWVEKLYVDYTGKFVRKGEPLMEFYSPELVTTQEEYLQALAYQKKLQQSNLDEARRGATELLESARRRLRYWDIPEKQIRALEERGTPKKTMTIYSPADGIVTEKMVHPGHNVMAGMEMYKIADLSTVWVLADIYQYELPWVKVGQSVDIELSYLPGRSFKGTITYIYPYLSEETKTAKVRVEVRNTASIELKPDMFATVKIVSPLSIEAVVVPDQAIIRSGERNIAVIALGGGYFDPREVKLGVQSGGYVEVLDGIKEGEKIVISSQFLIDSESNLKAAISQMSGHAGMDMSKPMEEPPPAGEEHQGQKTTDSSGTRSGKKDNQMSGQEGMDMSMPATQGERGAGSHKGHDMQNMGGDTSHEGHELSGSKASEQHGKHTPNKRSESKKAETDSVHHHMQDMN